MCYSFSKRIKTIENLGQLSWVEGKKSDGKMKKKRAEAEGGKVSLTFHPTFRFPSLFFAFRVSCFCCCCWCHHAPATDTQLLYISRYLYPSIFSIIHTLLHYLCFCLNFLLLATASVPSSLFATKDEKKQKEGREWRRRRKKPSSRESIIILQ